MWEKSVGENLTWVLFKKGVQGHTFYQSSPVEEIYRQVCGANLQQVISEHLFIYLLRETKHPPLQAKEVRKPFLLEVINLRADP